MTTTTEAIQETIYPWIQGNELGTKGREIDRSLFIDVRTPGEFEEVHIPDSTNIPLADLEKFLPELRQMAKDHSVTLVCRTQNRVKIAYDQLIKSGITNCRILEGGMNAWMAAGNPVIRGRHGYSLERQTRLTAGFMVMVGVALGVTMSPWFLLIPAAAGAGLFHAGLTDSCLMGIMLGKLPLNRVRSDESETKNQERKGGLIS